MKWPKIGVPGNGLLGREGISGFAKCASDIGQCSVSFFNSPIDLSKPDYHVIDTDYDNYSVVYNCSPGSQQDVVWIMSRSPTMSDSLL